MSSTPLSANWAAESVLEFDPRCFVTVAHEESAGERAMAQLSQLPSDVRPEALLVSGPAICKGAKKFLDTHPGWRPCVANFSDQPGTYRHSITYSYFDMGCAGWKLMEQLIRAPAEKPKSVYLSMDVNFDNASVNAAG